MLYTDSGVGVVYKSQDRRASILVFFFQAEDGIRDLGRSRGLGDVYKRQIVLPPIAVEPVSDAVVLNPIAVE